MQKHRYYYTRFLCIFGCTFLPFSRHWHWPWLPSVLVWNPVREEYRGERDKVEPDTSVYLLEDRVGESCQDMHPSFCPSINVDVLWFPFKELFLFTLIARFRRLVLLILRWLHGCRRIRDILILLFIDIYAEIDFLEPMFIVLRSSVI